MKFGRLIASLVILICIIILPFLSPRFGRRIDNYIYKGTKIIKESQVNRNKDTYNKGKSQIDIIYDVSENNQFDVIINNDEIYKVRYADNNIFIRFPIGNEYNFETIGKGMLFEKHHYTKFLTILENDINNSYLTYIIISIFITAMGLVIFFNPEWVIAIRTLFLYNNYEPSSIYIYIIKFTGLCLIGLAMLISLRFI